MVEKATDTQNIPFQMLRALFVVLNQTVPVGRVCGLFADTTGENCTHDDPDHSYHMLVVGLCHTLPTDTVVRGFVANTIELTSV